MGKSLDRRAMIFMNIMNLQSAMNCFIRVLCITGRLLGSFRQIVRPRNASAETHSKFWLLILDDACDLFSVGGGGEGGRGGEGGGE